MAKVMNDYVKTAEAIKEGKNIVVKRVYKKDGSTVEIYASNATQSNWEYMGQQDGFENESDFNEADSESADIELESNSRVDLLVENYKTWKDDDLSPNIFIDKNSAIQKYMDEVLESNIYKFLGSMRTSNGSYSNSYLKGLGRLAEFQYAKDVIRALHGKLTIPFRDVKRLFDLPMKMNSWKDLKTNKSMDSDMKGKVQALKALHKGNSGVVTKGLRAIKQNKPLPKGLSERDIRNLTIIMLSKYKKGKK